MDLDLAFEGDETLGPKIHDGLAEFVAKCTRKRVEKSKLSELKDKNPRPENCSTLKVPTVNPCIWKDLKKIAKSGDVQVQTTQSLVSTGLTSVIIAKDQVLALSSAKESNPKETAAALKAVNTQLTSAITLLGNAFLELSHRRRDALRFNLSKPYQSLCNKSTPVTDFLFGDKVEESIKEINETAKLSSSLSRNSSSSSSGRKGPSNTHQNNGGYLNSRGNSSGHRGRSRGGYQKRNNGGYQSNQSKPQNQRSENNKA